MSGSERRSHIIDEIKRAGEPISGSALAKKYRVSRQVVVQDIALLRAAGYDVVSTTRGYQLMTETSQRRIYRVHHQDDQIQDELNTIVDLGGCILDVYVDHDVYGRINAVLNIRSRRDVEQFMQQILTGRAKPLNKLTSGEHWHTVEAHSQEILDLIERELERKGYLMAAK